LLAGLAAVCHLRTDAGEDTESILRSGTELIGAPKRALGWQPQSAFSELIAKRSGGLFSKTEVFDGEIEAASTERRLAHTELLRAFAIDGDAAGGDEELEVLSMHSPRDGGEEVADWKTVVQTVGSRPPDTGPGWSMPRRAALPPARTSPPSLLDASPTAPADADPAGGDGSSDVSCSSAMSNQLGTHVSAIKNLYK